MSPAKKREEVRPVGIFVGEIFPLPQSALNAIGGEQISSDYSNGPGSRDDLAAATRNVPTSIALAFGSEDKG
jgi:hypothetical protein